MLSPGTDAVGRLIDAHFRGVRSAERDDGWFDVSAGAPAYFAAPLRRWPSVERRAMREVRGRVLDVGCGAGRLALYLQARGHEVVAKVLWETVVAESLPSADHLCCQWEAVHRRNDW
jgi:SAM-dependent methyltransferase